MRPPTDPALHVLRTTPPEVWAGVRPGTTIGYDRRGYARRGKLHLAFRAAAATRAVDRLITVDTLCGQRLKGVDSYKLADWLKLGDDRCQRCIEQADNPAWNLPQYGPIGAALTGGAS